MAALHLEVQALTGISTGTSPSNQEMADFLSDGVVDVINKVAATKPEELVKFASQTSVTNGNGTDIRGKIISVVREQSADKFYPATPIPAELRYLATDVDSLHYRSEYNPCWYVLDGKIYVLPAPANSATEARISMLNYVTPSFDDSSIASFPDEYEPLVIMYAAAMACLHKAGEIHNSLPTVPVFNGTVITYDDVTLPTLPVYEPPASLLNLAEVLESIAADDLELSDKYLSIVGKEMEQFENQLKIQDAKFKNDLDLYNKEIEVAMQNSSKNTETEIAQFNSDAKKFEMELQTYTSRISEEMNEYNWYLGRYASLINTYNNSVLFGKPPQPQGMPREQEN